MEALPDEDMSEDREKGQEEMALGGVGIEEGEGLSDDEGEDLMKPNKKKRVVRLE